MVPQPFAMPNFLECDSGGYVVFLAFLGFFTFVARDFVGAA